MNCFIFFSIIIWNGIMWLWNLKIKQYILCVKISMLCRLTINQSATNIMTYSSRWIKFHYACLMNIRCWKQCFHLLFYQKSKVVDFQSNIPTNRTNPFPVFSTQIKSACFNKVIYCLISPVTIHVSIFKVWALSRIPTINMIDFILRHNFLILKLCKVIDFFLKTVIYIPLYFLNKKKPKQSHTSIQQFTEYVYSNGKFNQIR